jgi:hypothetical protein
VLKTSVLLPCANPATARTFEELGASTINVATDLLPETRAELRAACSVPLDIYVEVPDDQGGFVRFYEVPDLIRAASPVYLKLGIRNAPNIYPAGLHLEDVAARLARERVPARSSCSGSSASWHPSCSRSAEPTGQPTSASPNPDTRVAEVLVSPL